jgi:Nuclear condensing complex subunits, C-term domain
MAINSFGLFINQVERAAPTLKLKALQIVFDMLTMYERDLCPSRPDTEEVRFLTRLLPCLKISLDSAAHPESDPLDHRIPKSK